MDSMRKLCGVNLAPTKCFELKAEFVRIQSE